MKSLLIPTKLMLYYGKINIMTIYYNTKIAGIS